MSIGNELEPGADWGDEFERAPPGEAERSLKGEVHGAATLDGDVVLDRRHLEMVGRGFEVVGPTFR